MTQLVQITDTHILPPGEILYGSTDTAAHLVESVRQINSMRPLPDVVLITGDLVENADLAAYRHFIDLVRPLEMPAYIIPGNHDDPQLMLQAFTDTAYFPAIDETYQYVIEDFPFRILALNSLCEGSELPAFEGQRLSWLEQQLRASDEPTLIAMHHPPMTTGIELIDMGGSEWFQGLKSVLADHSQVKLLICGHCHTDLYGRIGQVPVYMAAANSHQLIASRGLTIAPSSSIVAAAPILHHFIDGEFLSGSNPWPLDVDDNRIDKLSGFSWDTLKQFMKGSRG
jgi:3',5'-cyclic AMP phosphodiesterase CpdA